MSNHISKTFTDSTYQGPLAGSFTTNTKRPPINLSAMTQEERQIWIDFEWHEYGRHAEDILLMENDFKVARLVYGITPSNKYFNRHIEVNP
jgi:hypothetical protein